MAEGRTALPPVQSHYALESVLEPLDMEQMRIPSTKANPIQTEAFYLEILERLATRVVGLEALAKRAEGLADVLAALAERVGGLERGRTEGEEHGRPGRSRDGFAGEP